MKNNPIIIDGIWKYYDVVMFHSKFAYNTLIETEQQVVYPKFHITLRNKKHHDLVIKITSCYNNEDTYFFYDEKTGQKKLYLNTANYAIQLFDQNNKQWNLFGIYHYPELTINTFTKVYNKKLNEIRKKLHQAKDNPRVINALKDAMDEYMINELTKDLLPSIELIMDYRKEKRKK